MSILISVLAFIVALSILVAVHEFGHFWVARSLGVKVLRFSIGFGKPIWSIRLKRDDTEFAIGAWPLGGYVKMLDEREGDVAAADQSRAFNRQSLVTKSAIVVAGPAFNFIFAILAYWSLYITGIEDITPVVDKVVNKSIAGTAGFKKGDTLVRIDGNEVLGWQQHRLYLLDKALDRETVEFVVDDVYGQRTQRLVDLSQIDIGRSNISVLGSGMGMYAYFPELLAVAGQVEAGPAKRAGMLAGDSIVSIDGQKTEKWLDLVELISSRPNKQTVIVVERNGERHTLSITPSAIKSGDETIGRIGIRPLIPEFPENRKVTITYNTLDALAYSVRDTWVMSKLTLKILYKMILQEVSTRNISGPITIAQYAGYSAKLGLDRFVLFLAVVSISLGVLNLLPIPVLDGGHLLFYIGESIKGSPFSETVMLRGQQVGMLLLGSLMILAFYNDFLRLFY
ncbi:MAG: sigma E protease regulator RseP [Gammaproteobacteria bacterium]|nr:MAG: sigma E protease regulator RseP [Gammaproteobacteria bacterium]